MKGKDWDVETSGLFSHPFRFRIGYKLVGDLIGEDDEELSCDIGIFWIVALPVLLIVGGLVWWLL